MIDCVCKYECVWCGDEANLKPGMARAFDLCEKACSQLFLVLDREHGGEVASGCDAAIATIRKLREEYTR